MIYEFALKDEDAAEAYASRPKLKFYKKVFGPQTTEREKKETTKKPKRKLIVSWQVFLVMTTPEGIKSLLARIHDVHVQLWIASKIVARESFDACSREDKVPGVFTNESEGRRLN